MTQTQELISVKSEIIKVRSRRSLLEIDLTILKVICVPSRVTRLSRVSHLHLALLIARLFILEKKGLIEVKRIRLRHGGLSSSPQFSRFSFYSTTQKGRDLVYLWLKLQKVYGDMIA